MDGSSGRNRRRPKQRRPAGFPALVAVLLRSKLRPDSGDGEQGSCKRGEVLITLDGRSAERPLHDNPLLLERLDQGYDCRSAAGATQRRMRRCSGCRIPSRYANAPDRTGHGAYGSTITAVPLQGLPRGDWWPISNLYGELHRFPAALASSRELDREVKVNTTPAALGSSKYRHPIDLPGC